MSYSSLSYPIATTIVFYLYLIFTLYLSIYLSIFLGKKYIPLKNICLASVPLSIVLFVNIW
jgi:hypothetical protein